MKQLTVLLFVFLSFNCAAQITDAEIKIRIDKSLDMQLHNKTLKSFSRRFPQVTTTDPEGAPSLRNQSRPPGVYALLNDGMPCFVPDQKSVVAIPNSVTIITLPFQGTMPNAYGTENSKDAQLFKSKEPEIK